MPGFSFFVTACGSTAGDGSNSAVPPVTVNGTAGGLTFHDPEISVVPEGVDTAGDYAVPSGSGYAVLDLVVTNPGFKCGAQGQSGKEFSISLVSSDGMTALTTGVHALNVFSGPGYGSVADISQFTAQCVDTGVGGERARSGSVDITSLSLTHITATFTAVFTDGTLTGTIDTSIRPEGDAGAQDGG